MKTRVLKMAIAGILAVSAAGCVVGPDYERPATAVPDRWNTPLGGGETEGTPQIAQWWRSFGDPALDSLVCRALDANFDLRTAESRIMEARASESLAESDLWPALNASAAYRRVQSQKPAPVSTDPALGGASLTFSQQGASVSATMLPMGAAGPSVMVSPDFTGAGNSRVTVGTPQGARGSAGRRNNLYQAGFDASWELDIFGGARRGAEAARANREAAEEALRDVRVTLTAEVARQYFNLRRAQAGLDIAAKNIELFRGSLELAQSRFDAGLTTMLDVQNATAQLAASEAAVPGHAAEIQYAIHRLGVLLGGEPGMLQGELSVAAPLPAAPPEVPVGLPSDLLRRRPDVRRAERQLAASTALIGAATADLFPRVSLTGSLTGQDDALYGIKRNANMLWSIGPGISWPVFDAGRIRANIRAQNARQEQALAAYEKAVMSSLEDAENALVAYAQEQNRLFSLEKSAAAGAEAVNLATDLYTKGLVTYLHVLDAERTLSSAEAQCVQSRANVLIHLTALFKALGGGWDEGGDSEENGSETATG